MQYNKMEEEARVQEMILKKARLREEQAGREVRNAAEQEAVRQ